MLLLLAQVALLGQTGFTGNAKCGECHRNITKLYANSTMSREGVLCEQCHGAAKQHAAGAGQLEVPSALEPERRDGICAQCHFHGAGRIARLGRDVTRFRPGDLLTTYSFSFVYADAPEAGGGAVEQFATSLCRLWSGDRLWCGSCHDSHSGKTNREACQECHTAKQCGRGKDCAGCHMPGHDHSLRIRKTNPTPGWRLRPFTKFDTGQRELGLAYYEAWTKSGDRRQQAESVRLLSIISKKDRAVIQALHSMQKGIQDRR